ncbi:carboxymuconolactone decarboxylase family protein [Novosphingobium sp. G106]|uniref:carboxymuconolactone decarboxylase family protein n=1 Tax=Novosphingobium sp. G106 TaxID=2849500 RepID=UPI001C2D7312|nr:carboxymuconolactone decarboxylase family protein [Novosphingobium sp. G106]MBV1690885.1 carboxymuconolactone decarboxylase family protein [Novosphingobium sp. G106]
MPRIASLPVDQWDPGLRALLQVDTAPLPDVHKTILGVYANAPELAKPFFTFEAAFWAGFTLRRRLLEMMRLRIAFHNQCRSCMAMRCEPALEDGLTEDLVCSLERPVEAPDLTEAEKAALQFADAFATNHLAIDDETIEGLRRFYSEKEIVELCMVCAYCTGFGRFAAIYKAIEDLPESYQDMTARTTPWASDHTERVVVPF